MQAADSHAHRPMLRRGLGPAGGRSTPAPVGAGLARGRKLATMAAVWAVVALAALVVSTTGSVMLASPVAAQGAPEPPPIPELPVPTPPGPTDPTADTTADVSNDGAISIDIGTPGQGASQSVLLIVGLAVLSLAPSLVLMLSSFTRIIIVFSLTRNALGLQGIPPNQVLVGLALFLSLFVMAPTWHEVNDAALQPYLDGTITQEVAYDRATVPVHAFMLDQTRTSELQLMLEASGDDRPEHPEDVAISTLIPAFLLSELKTAFIMGFVIFIPFLIIDIVVASTLMALGMMMLPPVFVSLPFKLLLFVMVGGWSLIVQTLLASF
jgi:flagellar biosynthesis protein FliP